ncbi:MAG: ribosomal RNA small subunit methyltransferase A [Bdellovibrionales bacterium]|nr:ribosomal RNA small subunit methyltransferase A [Bdellovibrionales bacterium]
MNAKKSLGQNFLQDRSAVEHIAGLVPEGSPLVLEIGPGRGALTHDLARRARTFCLLEKDDALFPIIRGMIGGTNHPSFFPFHGDALEFDFERLWREPGLPPDTPLVVAANLPYNVASQILFRLLDLHRRIPRMALMFQKEVGLRLAALPGTKQYGNITVAAQNNYRVSIELVLKPGAFRPAPKVDSVVALFDRRERALACAGGADELARFHRLVQACFQHRRKTIENSLLIEGARIPFPGLGTREGVARALSAAGIDPRTRAETLPPERFGALLTVLEAARMKGDGKA